MEEDWGDDTLSEPGAEEAEEDIHCIQAPTALYAFSCFSYSEQDVLVEERII